MILIMCLIVILLLWLWKVDFQIKREWDCINFIYKTTTRDLYTGEYYDIYKSITIINFKN